MYSGIEEHIRHFEYLFVGLHGKASIAPFMWISMSLAAIAITMLLIPKTRKRENTLIIACIAIFISIWLEKGLGMVITGFIPSTLETITEYMPTLPEIIITIGVYGIGALILTILYKIVITVREQEA
jgi:molybdopterin-containing oxidoreductase family membrane subunit